MAKTLITPADAALYEEDFYLWVERQARPAAQGPLSATSISRI